MEGKSTNRIAWIDIFKAICIILVVVGHSTGKFNHYIYQFHMAAFFFISGYTSKIWKKDAEGLIINKAKTVLLPTITMIFGLAAIRAVKAVVLSELTLANGIKYIFNTLQSYLVSGSADSMLGAIWFLSVLFFVFIIQRIIWRSTEKRGPVLYMVVTVAVYLLGYHLQKIGYRQIHGFDIALIAQVYFAMGVVVSKFELFDKLRGRKWRGAIYVLAGVYMFLMTKIGQTTVDYPSRSYPSVLMAVIAPLGGILLVFGISELTEYLGKAAISVLGRLGRDSMGIIFLHFIGFKVATALLMPFKITVFDDLKSFLLPQSVATYGWAWIYYTVISILFSVAVWEILTHIPVLRFCLTGKSKKNQKNNGKEVTQNV